MRARFMPISMGSEGGGAVQTYILPPGRRGNATTATTLATNEAHDRQMELKLAGNCGYEILQCQLRKHLKHETE